MPASWSEGNNNNSGGGHNNNSSASFSQTVGGESGRDVVVFVIGGLAYSECRAAYEASAETGRNVSVGSTAVWQPQEFVRQLQHLANPHPPPVPRIERLGAKVQSHG